MRIVWCKQEKKDQWWGTYEPQFYIFKDGRKITLMMITNLKKNRKRFIECKSVQQAKRIANEILKGEKK